MRTCGDRDNLHDLLESLNFCNKMMNSISVLFVGIALEGILGFRLWEKWPNYDLCICKDVLSSKCSVYYRQLSA